MPYSKKEHGSIAAYERAVSSELSKRMTNTETIGASLLTTVLTTLKNDGIEHRGQVPLMYEREEHVEESDAVEVVMNSNDDDDEITAVKPS